MMNMERKRLPAIKASIEDVSKGKYCAQEGFNPNYVISPHGVRLSRVRLMSTVVDKFMAESGKFASLTLDDGTDTIRSKVFTDLSIFNGIETGDDVEMIGKVKEYQGEIYITPEIAKKIDDPNTEILRRLELRAQSKEWEKKRLTVLENEKAVSDLEELKKMMKERYGIDAEETEAIVMTKAAAEEAPAGEPKESAKEKLLKIIAENDAGEGCEYQTLIEKSGLNEDAMDTAIQELLDEGSCFEPKPGKIKKL
ncbi:MAG: hypothetical protein J4431_04105 [Candidatus Aenigmarchaeota archaeon]|nr:hypothetical protein [Candidatus Aenigmarchaeota archaeon]